jgi:hypothetical protein
LVAESMNVVISEDLTSSSEERQSCIMHEKKHSCTPISKHRTA